MHMEDAKKNEIENLFYMMRKICLNLTFQMDACLGNQDLNGSQVYFLVYLLRHHPDGTYITELCREVGVTKSSLSALIKKLRGKGYLYFEENPEDIRKKKVLPTQKLIAERNEFLQRADQMESEISSILEPQEKKELWDLERKLLTKLTEMDHRNKKTADRRLFYSEESVRTTETI